jgi:hypothetical protein
MGTNRSANFVEVLEYFLQRLKNPRFVIADSALPAKRLDDGLRCRQLILPQEREQMVFDLVIQPPVQKVVDEPGSHVA